LTPFFSDPFFLKADLTPFFSFFLLSVGTLDDIDDEKAFWLSKNVQERLAAIELNRRMVYGQDRVTSRLQRFLETSGSLWDIHK